MAEFTWVSVRHVVVARFDGDDAWHYEERITTWRASDMDAAIALAEAEVSEYCETLGTTDSTLYQAYLLADDPGPMVSGTETYSLIRKSLLPPDEYLDHFFDTGDEIQAS